MYADVRLGVGWNVFIRPIGDGLVHLRCGEESGETLDVGSAWRERNPTYYSDAIIKGLR